MNRQILTIDQIKAGVPYACVGGPFGSDLTTRDYVDEGIPVIRGSNLPADQIFLDDDFVFVSEQKANSLNSNLAHPGDLLFTQRGTLGQVALIPEDARFERYVVSQSQMKLTVDRNKAHPLFVYYYFRQPSVTEMIRRRAITSGVPHINLGILKGFKILLPSIPEQSSIATRLWDIDQTIRNNRRRIQLLERSARLLYKEWFVYLRFPGHEHVKSSNGVPTGWRTLTMEQACVAGDGIQTGPFGSQLHQSDYSSDGIPVVMPKDISALKISTDSIARVPEDVAQRLTRHRMQEGDVVYGRRGEIGRRAYVSSNQAGWLCGTGCLRLRPDPTVVSPHYFFDALGARETEGSIIARAHGVTMPNLNATILKSVSVVVPPRSLQQEYSDTASPLMQLVEKLTDHNLALARARDLLLPRLMSGEIEI